MSQLDWLKQWSKYSPLATALVDGENTSRSYNYQQLFHLAKVGAYYLKSCGIKKGDRIATLSMNDLDLLVLFFAAQRLGACLVPLNYRLTAHEIQFILNDCNPVLVIYQSEFSASLPPQATAVPLNQFSNEIKSRQQTFEAYLAEEEDAAMIIYTSGTTGFPKGAVLSHKMLFWNSLNTSLRLNISQTDSAVIFLPLFHTGGWNVLTTPFLHRGAKIILLKKFDADRVLSLCEREKTTLLFGVPTTMDLLARAKAFGSAQLSSIRYAVVGGEPMPLQLIQTWHDKGIAIRQGYGLTEFGPNVFSLNEEDATRKIGSIGFANFYVETKVVDSDGTECGPEQVGELLLKGPMCMSGYWQNPLATAETIKDGWLHTGDLVRFDNEGYFYVIGRKKEMYKSGGENVYPAEVEKMIRSFENVREVAVIGVADEQWGEVGKAFIVLDKQIDNPEDKLKEHLSQCLAKFKIPKYFRFVSDLPKGESGKILKRKLRELEANES